jgi:hypothetical protein
VASGAGPVSSRLPFLYSSLGPANVKEAVWSVGESVSGRGSLWEPTSAGEVRSSVGPVLSLCLSGGGNFPGNRLKCRQ